LPLLARFAPFRTQLTDKTPTIYTAPQIGQALSRVHNYATTIGWTHTINSTTLMNFVLASPTTLVTA